jgi:uncharacterized protein HemX
MTKYLIAAIAALVLALGGMGYMLKKQVEQAAVLEVQVKTIKDAQKQAALRRKKDAATLVAREREIASQARKLADAQQGLSEALQAEKAWSDTDVPTTVQKALSGGSDGSNSGPASLLNGSDREGEPKPGTDAPLP